MFASKPEERQRFLKAIEVDAVGSEPSKWQLDRRYPKPVELASLWIPLPRGCVRGTYCNLIAFNGRIATVRTGTAF
jgi:hypothetical protein